MRRTKQVIIDELQEEIQKLKNEIQKLKNENEIMKNNNNCHKLINERGAGRKSKFTPETIKDIIWYRENGRTISQLAKMYDCSTGLIHKLINENK